MPPVLGGPSTVSPSKSPSRDPSSISTGRSWMGAPAAAGILRLQDRLGLRRAVVAGLTVAGQLTADCRGAAARGRSDLPLLKALAQHWSCPVAFLDRKMTMHRWDSVPGGRFARDVSQDIHWNFPAMLYRTPFFLKRKYPPKTAFQIDDRRHFWKNSTTGTWRMTREIRDWTHRSWPSNCRPGCRSVRPRRSI